MELREHRRMPDDELLEVGEADGFAVETEIGVKQGVWLIERLVVDGIEQAANEVLVLFGGHASSSPLLNRPSPQLVTCPSESCHQSIASATFAWRPRLRPPGTHPKGRRRGARRRLPVARGRGGRPQGCPGCRPKRAFVAR